MVKRIKRGANKRIDWISLTLYLSLLLIGWLMIFASSYKGDEPINLLDFNSPYSKQLIWIILSLFAFILVNIIDPRFWRTFAYPIYGFGLLLLVMVLLFGAEVKGSKSWFMIGGFSLQPSEFAKFATAICLSAFLSYYKTDIKKRKHLLTSCALFLLPSFLILMQPDAGSALVFFSFFILLYRVGLSPVYYIVVFSAIALFVASLVFSTTFVFAALLLISAGVLFFNSKLPRRPYATAVFFILLIMSLISLYVREIQLVVIMAAAGILLLLVRLVQEKRFKLLINTFGLLGVASIFSYSSNYAFENLLKPHQQERLNVWLQPHLCDPRGSLYNVLQSKTAIGSGGLTGKGFLQGTMTKFNYVPEQTTDFIFCTIGEEQGYIGVAGIIFLYLFLLIRMVTLSERARSVFTKYYGYGITGIFFFHFIINIGMTMGLVPIIGIPLPFLSYGGSSLIAFSIMLAVLLRLDQEKIRY